MKVSHIHVVAVLILLVCTLAAVPLAAAEPPFSIWTTNSLTNVFRDTPQPARHDRDISLSAAGGEYESAQVVIVPPHALTALSASASTLSGPSGVIPRTRIQCRFVGYIYLDRNTWDMTPQDHVRQAPDLFPDPLLEQKVIPAQQNQNQPLLVTVHVPRGTTAGTYNGHVTIAADGARVDVPLSVEVMPFDLPKKPTLLFTNWFSTDAIIKAHHVEPFSEAYWKILAAYAKDMGEHRQTVAWTLPELVTYTIEPDGKITADFRRFDRWVTTFTRAGVEQRIELWGVGGRSTSDWNSAYVDFGHAATVRGSGEQKVIPVEQYLPPLVKHLREKGWMQRAMIHIGDESCQENVASWIALAKRVHAIAPDLRTIDAMMVANGIPGDLQVWVPLEDMFFGYYDGYHKAQQANQCELWFYTCLVPRGPYPNRFIDTPLIRTRIVHWVNALYGATGYLHWGLNWWDQGLDGFGVPKLADRPAELQPLDERLITARTGLPPGDAWIIYPGANGPRDSLRWEALRDGLEDYEYFRLLAARKGEQRVQELGRQLMRNIVDYDQDPAKLLRIRRQMAQEISTR